MTEEDDYKERLARWEKEEAARNEKPTEVKYWRLPVRMPWGCWIWLGILAFLGYHVLRWIFR
jgi:hypothetical protein